MIVEILFGVIVGLLCLVIYQLRAVCKMQDIILRRINETDANRVAR